MHAGLVLRSPGFMALLSLAVMVDGPSREVVERSREATRSVPAAAPAPAAEAPSVP